MDLQTCGKFHENHLKEALMDFDHFSCELRCDTIQKRYIFHFSHFLES